MPDIYFEDLHVGDVHEHGGRTVSREEIVDFARRFDPQPFHLDDAAGAGPFGGVIASGWHTASVVHSLLIDGLWKRAASLGSPGLDGLRWLKPVRPGDTISLKTTILELTPSQKKPDRGSFKMAYEVTNQRGEIVMTMVGLGIVGRRPAT
jgi:acyl dehydratase